MKGKDDIDYFKNNAEENQAVNRLIRQTKKALLSGIYLDSELNELRSNYSKALILIGKGAQRAGIEISKRTFEDAVKHELFHIAAHLAELLAIIFAESGTLPKQQRYFTKASQELTHLNSIHNQVITTYIEVRTALTGRSSYTAAVKAKLDSLSNSLSSITIRAKKTQFYATMVHVIRDFAHQDYARAALRCADSIHQARGASQKSALIQLRAVAAIAAGKYEMAESGLKEGLEVAGKYLTSWHILQYYRCIALFHKGDFKTASVIQQQAAKRKQTPVMIEPWAVVRAYLWIFCGGKFRLGKFFNETVQISKDKAGHNVNIIIADLMVSLIRDRDRFLHRIEAVQTYVYRHLKGAQHERTRAFLQLLFLAPECNFNFRLVRSRGAKHIKVLQKRSIYANHNLEIEIVPYLHLFELMIDEKRRAV
ncbi:MAG: hypothetical protein AAGG02_14925 [Cyanobacteria bacterium P01_H01_bin.15]